MVSVSPPIRRSSVEGQEVSRILKPVRILMLMRRLYGHANYGNAK